MASLPLPELPPEFDPIQADPPLKLVESQSPAESPIIYFEDWKQVKAARADERSFEQLVAEYMTFIRLKASGYFIAGASQEDVVQEALFGFYKAVRDYDGHSASFRSFAELCMTRQVITAVKTATRFKHAPLNHYVSFSHTPAGQEEGEVTLGDALPDKSPPIDAQIAGKEIFNNLIEILTTELSWLEYSVLKMYLEGASYREMAEELYADEKSIDNAFQRVKRKILEYTEE